MKHKLTLLLALLFAGIGYAMAQTQIQGTVVDEKGMPIIGANIIEKGNPSNGTATNLDGQFALSVSSNATIIVSSIGFTSQEILTTGKTVFAITMIDDSKLLDELVVVGYSSQRRESLTGSLQSIPSNKLKNITTPSTENMLNSKAPGVYVAPGSGQPGSVGAIVIRGKSTINGSTDPLLGNQWRNSR